MFSSESNFEHRLKDTHKIGKNKKGTGNCFVVSRVFCTFVVEKYKGLHRQSMKRTAYIISMAVLLGSVTEIARKQPYYFVMRDSSLANDQVADNFEQIWEEYSKDTVRKIM